MSIEDIPASVIAAYGLRAAAIAAILLLFLSTSSVEQYLSQPIVQLYSVLTEWMVRAGHGSITREGNVLIEPTTGATVYVTQACDGVGVLAIFLAMLLAARPGFWNFLRPALILIVVMQVWNLVRVVILFNLRSGSQTVYDLAHVYVSPYFTVILGLTGIALPVIAGLKAIAKRPTEVA
jgi:exosortase/archaeosortase family protein